MKVGLVTSTAMHAVLLGFGLVTLSAPRAYETVEEEAVMVDTIPIEEWTRIQEGEKEAPARETPAPLPTERPEVVEEAQRAGENTVDTEVAPTPEPKPRPVETAALPEPPPEPAPQPDPEPEPAPAKAAEEKPAPVPATEVTPEPQPKQEVEPDPVAETVVAENPEAEATRLPDTAPTPEARPQPPQAQTAKAPERKDAQEPAEKQAAKLAESSDELLDDVAALLNKEKPSGGGAKRSTREASLGAETRRNAEKLSRSEMDGLRQKLAGCWAIPAGIVDYELLKVSVRFQLDRAGNLEGRPEIIEGGASSGPGRIAAESAVRAVQKCEPFNLPSEKYDTWAEVIVHFDPSDMF